MVSPKAGKKSFKKKPTRGENRRPNFSYAGFVHSILAKSAKSGDTSTQASEPLARFPYVLEQEIKSESLKLFWRKHNLPGSPEEIRESPKPRRYRTTSQRSAYMKGNKLQLLFGDRRADTSRKVFVESLLEPREHAVIYIFLQKTLSKPENRIAATHLNYLIIRGNYKNYSVIFNVDLLNGAIVRRLKIVAEQLQKLSQPIHSAFIYLDPTKSGYYLEGKKPNAPVQFKRLFGPAHLTVTHNGMTFQFHPTSFSQVNESMVPVMLKETQELIGTQQKERLIDLYCGYGLFSCFLSKGFKQIYGIDGEGPSIQFAKTNAKRISAASTIRFRASRISEDVFEKLLPVKPMQETIILDPPRQGPKDGVIESLSKRNPKTVLHIFCGVDQIPSSIRMWKHNGYRVERVVPLDMFPGTLNLEILILLKPES